MNRQNQRFPTGPHDRESEHPGQQREGDRGTHFGQATKIRRA